MDAKRAAAFARLLGMEDLNRQAAEESKRLLIALIDERIALALEKEWDGRS